MYHIYSSSIANYRKFKYWNVYLLSCSWIWVTFAVGTFHSQSVTLFWLQLQKKFRKYYEHSKKFNVIESYISIWLLKLLKTIQMMKICMEKLLITTLLGSISFFFFHWEFEHWSCFSLQGAQVFIEWHESRKAILRMENLNCSFLPLLRKYRKWETGKTWEIIQVEAIFLFKELLHRKKIKSDFFWKFF